MHQLGNATIDNMQNIQRLTDQFLPDNYNLLLTIDRTQRKFNGIINITGKAPANNKIIKLHSKDLLIDSVVLNGNKTSFICSKDDELIIDRNNHKDEDIVIRINFSGNITDSMHGLYPCYYKHNDIKKELIATQFESHHAREVFPCIDEPAAKATFDLTLVTEPNVKVLGNMPIKLQTEDKDGLTTVFETTPIMSSYLLAWVIGELHKKTAHTKSGVEVNVWATPAQPKDNLDFALDIATRSIDFFDEYFETNYPLLKVDHVALPDFASGAMENWGLITYREIALLADPVKTSISNKRYIATVIAHELSHQWFGNLVTMQWWNDLWLNESFASLVEYDAVDNLEPSWKCWMEFATYSVIMALKRDSLSGVQPVQTNISHPDEISTLFDGAIVYAKGARLLQMLRNYIGEEAFRAGLKEYFKKHAYKNTVANDLWTELGKTSNKDIGSFMKTWISQPGFPVVHVNKTGNQLNITQERLRSNNSENDTTLWPITLNSNCDSLPKVFDQKSLSVTVNNDKPIQFNIGSFAHFITHYDKSMLSQIINELTLGNLSTIDRLQLLNEQSILANAGIISYADLIPLLIAYKDETEEPVWDVISIVISELKKFVYDDPAAEIKLRNLAKLIAIKQYRRLGLVKKINEPETDTKLRPLILGIITYSEDKKVISAIKELFKSTTIEDLDPEIRSSVLSIMTHHTDDDRLINSMIKIYKTTNSSDLKQDITLGLTSTKDIKTIELIFDNIKDKSFIKTQDVFRWFAYLIRNKYSRDLAWQWLRDNWDWIITTFTGDKNYDDYPRLSANALITKKQLDEFRDFFEPMKSDPILTRVINMGINEITDRTNLIDRDKDAVIKSLLNF